ncbi:hypothetical protein [Accumulibacter sp.]|uniref:hypothetical protein n=1 Tax=Accumulibacter sp. TaxID=2053492 RepID=UPI00260B0417|nr:hypothetical protein [Accumulibacter sp.]
MTVEIELPPGWVLCPKGGRPPKVARDVAVFLALAWFDHKNVHTKVAADWIIDHFGFSERSEIRRARRKAARACSGQWVLVVFRKALFFTPATGPAPTPGATGWAWCDEMREALPIRVANVVVKSVFSISEGYKVVLPWPDNNGFGPGQ